MTLVCMTPTACLSQTIANRRHNITQRRLAAPFGAFCDAAQTIIIRQLFHRPVSNYALVLTKRWRGDERVLRASACLPGKLTRRCHSASRNLVSHCLALRPISVVFVCGFFSPH